MPNTRKGRYHKAVQKPIGPWRKVVKRMQGKTPTGPSRIEILECGHTWERPKNTHKYRPNTKKRRCAQCRS